MIRRLTDANNVSEVVLHTPAVLASRESAPLDNADAGRYSDGYREGFEAGESDGLRDAETRLSHLESELRARHETAEASLLQARDRWNDLTKGLAQAEHARVDSMEKDALEIALLALSAAFGESIDDRERLSRMVTQVIQDYRSDALCLRVAEADLSLLTDEIEGIRVEAHASVMPGSCILTTARGRIESSIEERLDAIHRSMIKALPGAVP